MKMALALALPPPPLVVGVNRNSRIRKSASGFEGFGCQLASVDYGGPSD